MSRPKSAEVLLDEDVKRTLRVISDPARCKILTSLAKAKGRRLNVSEIVEILGTSQPATSHHLSYLRMSGIVDYTREGPRLYYSIRSPGAIEDAIAGLKALLPKTD